MSKKSETKKAAGQKNGSEQSKQATVTTGGGERTTKRGKTMPPEGQIAAAENGKPIDQMLNQAGIHPQPLTAPTPTNAKAVSSKPPDQPDDASDLCVFAFRLTRGERDEIHAAAGSAKASKFVKSVALAAARRDATALQAAIQAVEQNRKS